MVMKILHLLSDWKWTGPAEPVLDLCVELKNLGCNVILACKKPQTTANISLYKKACEANLKPIIDFTLNKKFNLLNNALDIQKLMSFFLSNKIDILHTHQSHDHIIGGIAARLSRKTKIIRTNYQAKPLSKCLLNSITDANIVFSKKAADSHLSNSYIINPGMRLERYNPQRANGIQDSLRQKFGISKEDFVVGVIARIQRHRRFDVLLEGIKIASQKLPNLKVLIVGRGTHRNEVAQEPAHKLGLDNIVHFVGYLTDNYIDILSIFDTMVFLVPGSDGTCRALREAMAMAKPVIGANRGMIPELIDNNVTGLVIDDTPENIADAIIYLAQDKNIKETMGIKAREKALKYFSIREQAKEVIKIYERTLGK